MKQKKEGVFCSQLRKDFYGLYPDDFFRKIPDSFGAGKGATFTPESPIDIYLSKDSKFYGIEAKFHDKHTAWRFDSVKEHQVNELLQMRRKNIAYIFINIRQEQEGKKIKKNIIACYDISDFIYVRGWYWQEGKKSIKVSDLMLQSTFLLERVKLDNRTYWDWERFFQYAKGETF